MTSTLGLQDLRRAADARVAALARRFGDTLRVGDGAAAERIVNEGLGAGLAPAAIQSLVITPAMVRIGELWESRAIGVADEHLATSISNRALIRLFETISANRAPSRSRERVLLAAVEGQHHVLGLRMVADVLEGAGFDVLYLGEDVPVGSLRDFVARHRPAVVGLAFGIAIDVACLAEALCVIHETSPEIRVMLGGRAVPPALRTTGYPVVADTLGVVDAVDGLLAGPPQPLPAEVDRLRSAGARRFGSLAREPASVAAAAMLARAAEEAVDIAREHVRRADAYRGPAFRDQRSNLVNRRAFEDALNEIAGAPDAGGMLLMIDVDGLRVVNDEQGQAAGDRLLSAIGLALVDAVRAGDVAARFGGDVFAVLLPGATGPVAREMSERIRAVAADVAAPLSVSVGIAAVSDDARGGLLAADTALYDAKAAGGDCVIAASETRRAAREEGS